VVFDNSEDTDRFQGLESTSNINQAIAITTTSSAV